MRLLSAVLLLSLISIPTFSMAQTTDAPVPLTMKLDPSVKSLVENLINAQTKYMPGTDANSKLVLDAASPLDQGLLQGDFTYNADFTTRMEIKLTAKSADKVTVTMTAAGKLPTDKLIAQLTSTNQLLCIRTSNGQCAVIPLLTEADSTLSNTQKATIAFKKLKENLVSYFNAIANPEEALDDQAFTDEEAAATQQLVDNVQLAGQLAEIIQQSFLVTESADSTELKINMDGIRQLGPEVTAKNPGLGFIVSFQSVQFVASEVESSVSVATQNEVPAFVIRRYNEFVQKQQGPGGTIDAIAKLIAKIGPKVVETCNMNKANMDDCLNHLFAICVQDEGSPQWCVDKLARVSFAQDQHRAGDDIGAAATMAGVVADTEKKKASDSFWNFLTGGPK